MLLSGGCYLRNAEAALLEVKSLNLSLSLARPELFAIVLHYALELHVESPKLS